MRKTRPEFQLRATNYARWIELFHPTKPDASGAAVGRLATSCPLDINRRSNSRVEDCLIAETIDNLSNTDAKTLEGSIAGVNMKLASAGNVIIPAIKIIEELGYELRVEKADQLFIAENGKNTFIGEDPITILGLIKIYEVKGESWQMQDAEIENIGRKYNLLG